MMVGFGRKPTPPLLKTTNSTRSILDYVTNLLYVCICSHLCGVLLYLNV